MNISGGNRPAMSSSGQGGEVYTAALSKKQQFADGAAALALIEGPAQPTSAPSPAQSVTATLGNTVTTYL